MAYNMYAFFQENHITRFNQAETFLLRSCPDLILGESEECTALPPLILFQPYSQFHATTTMRQTCTVQLEFLARQDYVQNLLNQLTGDNIQWWLCVQNGSDTRTNMNVRSALADTLALLLDYDDKVFKFLNESQST